MKKKAFHLPMNKTEAIVGWIYVFIHTFAMVYILMLLNAYIFPKLGFTLSSSYLNLTYYAFGFVFLLIFLFKFLKESFADLCSNLLDTLIAVVAGYFIYIALMYAVNFLLGLFLNELTNPNSSAVISETKLNPNTMLAIGVLLAPVVEEVLFRGVVFGTIRRKHRITAYIVSSVFFAVYHLWEYIVYSFSPAILLYLIQYIPAGLVLGWCYERGRNLWCPVFLHMIINYISISVSIG
ncbi:MAG: lysostaphin resistance A-like protein [Oscillospiraceae bacterium]